MIHVHVQRMSPNYEYKTVMGIAPMSVSREGTETRMKKKVCGYLADIQRSVVHNSVRNRIMTRRERERVSTRIIV